MNFPSVFISYNPNSEIEQVLAVRLHTIGNVNGFRMQLPDRSEFHFGLSSETQARIKSANYFIVFSTISPLSSVVQSEIEVAYNYHNDRSKIIIIYDVKQGKNLRNASNCTEVFVNLSDDIQTVVNHITNTLKSKNTNAGGSWSDLGAILLTGLGLFALANIVDDALSNSRESKSKPKKRSTKRSAAIKKKT